ncbi:hypothetical protein [Nocardiopsis coralliicola]
MTRSTGDARAPERLLDAGNAPERARAAGSEPPGAGSGPGAEGVTVPGPDVLIVGGGSLTRAVCYALATIGTAPCTVTVVSRTAANAAEISYVANARAALSTSPARFRPAAVERYSAGAFGPVLRERRPALVLNCASHQSPWEGTHTPSAWTDLIRRRGFGFTLPLQSAIALELARALASSGTAPQLVNACFPDAVNPVLKAAGLPVLCGIGNVALLAATLQAGLGLRDQARLSVLGHHWHLHAPHSPEQEALAWLDGAPVAGVTGLLAPQRAASRAELNAIHGHVAALVLDALLGGGEFRTSLPGVAGLPGGYPVRVRSGAVELCLPDALTLDGAVALNQEWTALEGVRVSADGAVSLAPGGAHPAASASGEAEIPARFAAGELAEVCRRMLRLRSRLRRHSAGPP